VPASALDRDLQAGGIPHEPLNVETADDWGFALDLNLGELLGVPGVFLFLELNGFGFLFHDLILVDGFRLIDMFLAQVFSQPADTLGEDWHGVKPLAKKVVASNHRAASEKSGGHFLFIPQCSADCGVCFAGFVNPVKLNQCAVSLVNFFLDVAIPEVRSCWALIRMMSAFVLSICGITRCGRCFAHERS